MEVLQDRYKDTKVGRIPKDWEVMMLNEITNYKSSNLSLNKLEENTGKYKLYGASGMLKGIDFYQTDKESFAIVKDGSGFGNLLWCDKNSSILGTLGRITNKETSDLKFCFYLTHTIKFKRYMSGSTIPHLYYKDYGNIKLPVPPLPEQQKIAAILSTVDEQISTTDKIIEKSKELKKGLMQKLFSEGIGHTEFKDTKIGRVPKGWDVIKLNSIAKSFVGIASSATHAYRDSGVLLLRNQNIKEGRLKLDDVLYVNEEYELQHKTKRLKVNDILSVRTGYPGMSAVVTKELEGSQSFTTLITRINSVNIDSYYLCYFINSPEGKAFFKRSEAGGGQKNVGAGTMSKMFIPIPSLSEQQKIVAILSEADAKIEKEQTQKAQLEQLKKGLMQQLLTGKKRVA